jgi:hypothetical protein
LLHIGALKTLISMFLHCYELGAFPAKPRTYFLAPCLACGLLLILLSTFAIITGIVNIRGAGVYQRNQSVRIIVLHKYLETGAISL